MHFGKIMFVAIFSGYPFYIGYFDKTKLMVVGNDTLFVTLAHLGPDI